MDESTAAVLFSGDSEMARRMRGFDWLRTPLGPVEQWPRSLKTVVRILLTSRYAMWLGWGPEFTFFYNDTYGRMTLGGKHPWALGRSARQVWAEIWHDIGPRAESVVRTGVATWDEALLLFLERSGYVEETYHTFSYSPILDDGGAVGGMLCVVAEDTERVIGERRLALLRELASDLAATHTEEEVFAVMDRHLAARAQDSPFTLTYLFDGNGKYARLACASGIAAGSPPAPTAIDLSAETPWPAHEVLARGTAVTVEDLAARFGELPTGPWDKPAKQAVLVPLARQGQERPAGFLVAAINPYRVLDAGYSGFLDLLAGQIASAIGNARAYEEERRRAEKLAELDRAKTLFFTNISHEFRTPLTLMLGPVEDMLAKPEGGVLAENRPLLHIVHRHSLRLLKLVNTLLDFSRIEAGRMQAVYERTDIAALTSELASMFRSAIEKAGMRLIIDCPNLDAPVFLDRDLWEKIVLNLLSNAFKFTFAGEIEVRLRLVGEMVELTVRDSGVGIAAKDLPHVFERFHRVEGVKRRSHEGTGIGLALVYELTKLHGGSVAVDSMEGQGTTFTVSIPTGSDHLPSDRIGGTRTLSSTSLAPDVYVEEVLRWLPPEKDEGGRMKDESIGASSFHPSSFRPHPSEQRPRIVLADDNADMREYVRRLLSQRYDVEAVADGRAALDAIRRRRPDVVLTDVMMPELDGFGLLQQIRAEAGLREIPVLMLSARAGEEARIEGVQAGADDYIIKPFNARELLARVESHLRLARLRRETADVLRKSEERFRTLTETLPNLVWTDLPDGQCDWLSSQWGQYTGIPENELLGLRWLETVIHPDDRERALACWTAACADKGEYDLEYRIRRYDGEYRWFKTRGVPIRDEQGKIVYWIGTCTDIEDSKQLEAALRDADRRKDEFLATLAHELRNPLAPIRNSLQILRLSGGSSPTAERVHEMMERQVNHMVRLVDDLMEVSRITRGKIELRKERVELAAIIRGAVETSKPLIEAAGHQLAISLPAEPLTVEADPVRLAQVLANLLNNAAKYTEEKGQIWLTVRPEGEEVVVSVRDTGLGIPADMLPRVFEMFTQIDRNLKRAQGGLGIGLTLVKNLVQMHGGRIEAHSDGAGKGSEFTIRLPLATGSRAAESTLDGCGRQPISLSSRRVLVVDDNRDAADSLGILMKLLGTDVRVLYDGSSALEAIRTYRPVLVFLDIGMPGTDGYEVARQMRQDPQFREVMLIALTGWSQEEDRRRSQGAGFDHHLVKPVDLNALQAILAAVEDAVPRP